MLAARIYNHIVEGVMPVMNHQTMCMEIRKALLIKFQAVHPYMFPLENLEDEMERFKNSMNHYLDKRDNAHLTTVWIQVIKMET